MRKTYQTDLSNAEWSCLEPHLPAPKVSRPRKPAPEEVRMAWAKEWAKEGVTVDWQKAPHATAGIRRLATSVGRRADVFLNRPEQEDE
jgi:transposase